MKRVFYILSAFAALAGCVRNEVTPGAGEAIGLEVTTSRAGAGAGVTRGAVATRSDLASGGFRVYATAGSAATGWYGGIGGTVHGWDGARWNFAPAPVPWPASGSDYPVVFHAWHPVSPAGAGALTAVAPVGGSGGELGFTYTAPAAIASQEDLLWGSAVAVSRPAGGTLPIAFSHLLSKIDIAFTVESGVTATIIETGVANVAASRRLDLFNGMWGAAPSGFGARYAYAAGDAAHHLMLVPQSGPAWSPARGVGADGACVYVLYRMHRAGQPADLVDQVGFSAAEAGVRFGHQGPLYVLAGFPLPAGGGSGSGGGSGGGSGDFEWLPGRGYTYNVTLGAPGGCNGYVMDDHYYAADGTRTQIPLRDGRQLGEPLQDGEIHIALELTPWDGVPHDLPVPVDFTFSPASLAAVTNDGGTSGAVGIVTDPFSAGLPLRLSVAMSGGVCPDGHTLKHHTAELVDPFGVAIDPNTDYPASQQFCVRFPKVYYPNRQTPISATVTATLGGTVVKTIQIHQEQLTPRPVVAHNHRSGSWAGSINPGGTTGYAEAYKMALFDTAVSDIPIEVRPYTAAANWGVLPPGQITWASYNANYMHVVLNEIGTNEAAYFDWSPVNEWKSAHPEGWLVLCGHIGGSIHSVMVKATWPTSPLYPPGYRNASRGSQTGKRGVINQNPTVMAKKVFRYLTDKAPGTPVTVAEIPNGSGFYYDNLGFNFPLSGLPSTAVPIVLNGGNINNGHATTIVDIENRLLIMGETEHHNWGQGVAGQNPTSGTYVSQGYQAGHIKFTGNLARLVKHAAAYGSHFTDLLLETGRPNAQPAPWDDTWWGENADQ